MMEGDYGNHLRSIMSAACAPIYWHWPEPDGRRPLRTNGTVTFIQSEERLFGVTAAHVIRGYLAEADHEGCVLQIGLGAQQHALDLIAVDDDLDLATFQVTERAVATMGKEIVPVSLPRPGDVPQEGRGIMIAGYIGEDRIELPNQSIGFGMLCAITVARRVNDRQITWKPDRDFDVPIEGLPPITRHKNLGGTSGGPVVAMFRDHTGYSHIIASQASSPNKVRSWNTWRQPAPNLSNPTVPCADGRQLQHPSPKRREWRLIERQLTESVDLRADRLLSANS